jgi:hypothetical protein
VEQRRKKLEYVGILYVLRAGLPAVVPAWGLGLFLCGLAGPASVAPFLLPPRRRPPQAAEAEAVAATNGGAAPLLRSQPPPVRWR